MNRWLSILLGVMVLTSCATGGSMSSGGGGAVQTSSPESKARDLTNRMRTVLDLDKAQEEKALSINLVNQKLLQRMRESNDQSIAKTTRENYHKELKAVLSEAQFAKFRSSFPDL
jgi:hypothetical protein